VRIRTGTLAGCPEVSLWGHRANSLLPCCWCGKGREGGVPSASAAAAAAMAAPGRAWATFARPSSTRGFASSDDVLLLTPDFACCFAAAPLRPPAAPLPAAFAGLGVLRVLTCVVL
jgi:hypothetical protein